MSRQAPLGAHRGPPNVRLLTLAGPCSLVDQKHLGVACQNGHRQRQRLRRLATRSRHPLPSTARQRHHAAAPNASNPGIARRRAFSFVSRLSTITLPRATTRH